MKNAGLRTWSLRAKRRAFSQTTIILYDLTTLQFKYHLSVWNNPWILIYSSHSTGNHLAAATQAAALPVTTISPLTLDVLRFDSCRIAA